MGISKIGSLFASNVDPTPRTSVASKRGSGEQSQSTQSQQASISSDAVIISRSTAASSSPRAAAPNDDSRAERLKELKGQVSSGAYRPDAEKVAVAVLKELS